MPIINAHIHIFTIENVPKNFLPLRLVQILNPDFIRKPLGWLIKHILPFTDRDLLDRYVNFIEITANKTQEETFLRVRKYYPKNTRFIVLPMDMEFMAAGECKEKYEDQLHALSQVHKKFPDQLIPFVAIDPRRLNVKELLIDFIENHQFKGIKMYPALGFYPSDERLLPIYEYAQNRHLPIISHCAKSGIYTKKISDEMLQHPMHGELTKCKPKQFSAYFSEPKNYEPVLKQFPKLKICLAHFGGSSEWDNYLENEWDYDGENVLSSWVADIVNLMEKYENVYTDIAFTAFHSDRYFPLLSILLDNDKIKGRILYGSDYYMVEREKLSEREMSLKVRYALGETKFKWISEDNVLRFLG